MTTTDNEMAYTDATRTPDIKSGGMPTPIPLFLVIPRGRGFFHIKEARSGAIRGYRVNHAEACALARKLEVSHGTL